jgi:hypothetical protein
MRSTFKTTAYRDKERELSVKADAREARYAGTKSGLREISVCAVSRASGAGHRSLRWKRRVKTNSEKQP